MMGRKSRAKLGRRERDRGERTARPSTGRPSVLSEARRARQQWLAADAERRRRYGQVRPIIQVKHKGYRFVAVGGRLFYAKNWNSFPDFLSHYVRHIFGSGWWKKEAERPELDRHPVVRWYDHVMARRREARTDVDGFVKLDRDGPTNAHILLAYDLYVLRHHGKLQSEVIRRLRRHDHFLGARYELWVTSTFIRAGFDVRFSDESDPSTKHPEFVATHHATGFVLAVEAKAKFRPGSAARTPTHVGVKGLLLKAAEKGPKEPFVVFLDLNVPPCSEAERAAWTAEIDDSVGRVAKKHAPRTPFDVVAFTNVIHENSLPKDLRSGGMIYTKWPTTSRVPEVVFCAIIGAAQQYGNVPNLMPDDPNQPEDTL